MSQDDRPQLGLGHRASVDVELVPTVTPRALTPAAAAV